MKLAFSKQELIDQKKDGEFSGIFLNRKSYMELLQLADAHFDLNLRTQNSSLQNLPLCYMLMSKKRKFMTRGLGMLACVTINSLTYNTIEGFVVANVMLKTNYTCNKRPVIVIAKKSHVSNADIQKILCLKTNLGNTIVEINPKIIHGKIGIVFDYKEENDELKAPENVEQVRAELDLKLGDPGVKEFYKGKEVMTSSKGKKFFVGSTGHKNYISGDNLKDIILKRV